MLKHSQYEFKASDVIFLLFFLLAFTSVGIEDADDLIKDLTQALAKA